MKRYRYFSMMILLVVLGSMYLSSCSDKATEVTLPVILDITNNTSLDFKEDIFIRPHGGNEWEVFTFPIRWYGYFTWENEWGINSGNTRSIILTHKYADSNFDIMMAGGDGNPLLTYIKNNVALKMGTNKIEFTDDDYNGVILVITNNTSLAATAIAFRQDGASYWTVNTHSVPSGQTNRLYSTASPGLYDVQMVCSNATFTVSNQQLNRGANYITFTDANADQISINITNNTGVTTNAIYVKPSTAADWGANLSSSNLTNGNSRLISLATSFTEGLYDIQIRTSTGITFTVLNKQLNTGTNNVTITADDRDPVLLTIENNTGVAINSIYLKTPSASSWGTAIYTTEIANGASSPAITLEQAAGSYDIQLRSNTNLAYTKTAVQLSIGGNTQIFTSDDNSNMTLTITNNTSVVWNGVYVRPSGQSAWGTNLITTDIAVGSTSSAIAMPASFIAGYHYIRVTTSTGASYTRILDMTVGSNTTSMIDSFKDKITIIIANSTGYAVQGIHIRPNGTTSWTSLNTAVLSSGSNRTIELDATYNPGQYDVQVRWENGTTYYWLKTNVSLNVDGSNTLTYTNSDYYGIFVRYYNYTGSSQSGGYIRTSGSSSWNTAFSNSIPHSSNMTVMFPASWNPGYYDCRLGSNKYQYNVNCQRGTVTNVYFY